MTAIAVVGLGLAVVLWLGRERMPSGETVRA